MISLYVYNNSPYKITLSLGLLGYCESNGSISPTKEVAYRVNNILQVLDICQSTILEQELSINNIISNEKGTTDCFTKTPSFEPTFQISNYTEEQQKFLTMFNFQYSQITQNEFEQLADLLLKFPKVYATLNLMLEKKIQHYIYLQNLMQFSKNNEQVKSQFTYKTKSTDYLKY